MSVGNMRSVTLLALAALSSLLATWRLVAFDEPRITRTAAVSRNATPPQVTSTMRPSEGTPTSSLDSELLQKFLLVQYSYHRAPPPSPQSFETYTASTIGSPESKSLETKSTIRSPKTKNTIRSTESKNLEIKSTIGSPESKSLETKSTIRSPKTKNTIRSTESKNLEIKSTIGSPESKSPETKFIVRSPLESRTSREQNTTSVQLPPCPSGPVVACQDGGRLGNKIWEYAAAWGLGRALGRPTFVPASALSFLSHVFANLSVPSLESVAHCNLDLGPPLKRYQVSSLNTLAARFQDKNILLHKWMVHPEPVLAYKDDIHKEFKFVPHILKKVENAFNYFSKKGDNFTYIGVHVRRTDFATFLPREYNVKLVGAKFFLDAMAWYRKTLKGPLRFMVVSDDPRWCERELIQRAKDAVLVARAGFSNPGYVDMAIMAACNHTIIDYGTFGAWGALMAGGYTISLGLDTTFNKVVTAAIPNWRVWKL